MPLHHNLTYAPQHAQSGLIDVHRPEAGGLAPVVVVYHGGGLQALRKERMGRVAAWLASCGWVVVNANYRLLPEAPFPAPLVDALAVVDWVEQHAGEFDGDASRLALLGASAGGYLVLMAGLLLGSARVRGIVDLAGPTTKSYGRQPAPGEDARRFQPPVELVGPDAPPLLAVHSSNDELVVPSESQTVVERWRSAGRPAELFIFAGEPPYHGIWREEAEAPELLSPIEAEVEAFLRRVLV